MESSILGNTNKIQPEPPSPRRKKLWANVLLVIILLAATFAAGFYFGQNKINFEAGKIEITRGSQSNEADYGLLWNVLDLLNNRYVGRNELDQEQLLYGAIKGLLEATDDPYTVFFDPKESEEFAKELRGTFDGIGAEIGMKDNRIVVIAPLDGSPAQRAGILQGDAILFIDKESTADLNIEEAVSRIRGKAGTTVTLNILHDGDTEARDITITRETIEVKSVTFETKEVDGKRIAYIKIIRFGEDTEGLFDHAVDVALAGGHEGMILDLRNNTGGYLETSIDIVSNWVEHDKVVVKEVNYNGDVKDYTASGLARLATLKTVVLVNGGSASASEILAGALQDYKLAIIVGTKTFGKGSVQELTHLDGGSTAKITIAKWHTPNDRSIDGNGLEPDMVVERTSEQAQANQDPQLDKALELFK